MVNSIPLDPLLSTTSTTTSAIPVYRYLMQQPDHWMRQAFFVGRPKLPISRVVESMRENSKSVEETAQDWALPEAAIAEALDYYQRFSDLVEADAADELALSEELTQR
jgi:uncharacterized protein (DUF433 family)